MNNLDLHLIKGRPCVHPDDDLIVGHIAISVDADKMDTLRERLTSFGIKFRINVSGPNPTITAGPGPGKVDQVNYRLIPMSGNIFLRPRIIKNVRKLLKLIYV